MLNSACSLAVHHTNFSVSSKELSDVKKTAYVLELRNHSRIIQSRSYYLPWNNKQNGQTIPAATFVLTLTITGKKHQRWLPNC